MNKPFQTIALMSRQDKDENTTQVLKNLLDYLRMKGRQILFEKETATCLQNVSELICPLEEIGQHADLIIVVGGDGSLLQAAQIAVRFNKPILGINRGYLGFLTDIHPDEITTRLGPILEGTYQEEQRFLLNTIIKKETPVRISALNDVVLLPGKIAHLIEFDIFIDEKFVSHQRADGLIVATPTGSTAYALSGGGPILHPSLDAIVLVPMFPHTLSSRPIVISGNSQVTLRISPNSTLFPRLSCDGQAYIALSENDAVHIQKKPERLRLIHPIDYDYFETLRAKLHWERK
jgi:NAD+ kinase